MNDYNEINEGDGVSVEECVLDFIKNLEGFTTRLRELHWASQHKSTHELTDDMVSKITEYEDRIAECYMGVIGMRITPGDVVPNVPDITSLQEIISSIINNVLNVKACIEDEERFYGMNNILDDMIEYLDKCKYLSTMS